jgi:hypothetical protein
MLTYADVCYRNSKRVSGFSQKKQKTQEIVAKSFIRHDQQAIRLLTTKTYVRHTSGIRQHTSGDRCGALHTRPRAGHPSLYYEGIRQAYVSIPLEIVAERFIRDHQQAIRVLDRPYALRPIQASASVCRSRELTGKFSYFVAPEAYVRHTSGIRQHRYYGLRQAYVSR